jgi:hypothetical protein
MAETPLRGYGVVPDSGGPCPYSGDGHGTEAANEGKASGGNRWAKRKGGASAPATESSGEGD